MQVSGAISDVLVTVPSTASSLRCSSDYSSSSNNKSFLSASSTFYKSCSSFYVGRLATGLDKSRSRGFLVRASNQSGEEKSSISPVHLESPAGQLLTQILQTHPHFLPAAIDQQLENLQNDREAQKKETPSSSQDLLLYRRIAEVKEKDRKKTLQEILYCLILHKFVENNISMIPKMTPAVDITGRIDFWPDQEQKLESVHSAEAFEMIQSHLSLVLGERQVGPLQSLIEISKIKLGKLYAASIMYGYFLRRVDQRYQLERSMNTLPKDFGKNTAIFQEPPPQNPFWDPDSLIEMPADEEVVGYGDPTDLGDSEATYKLRSYVMYLDTETLQRYATIRSKEAMTLIERQTQALFGQPDIRISEGGVLETQNDEIVSVTFSGLTMLVLEAVAFGSFLWDAEDYVESKYNPASS